MTPFPAMALVKKELFSKLRSRWLFVVIAGFVLVAMFVIREAWPVRELLPHDLAGVSTRLTAAVYGILLAVCTLVIPAIAATSISLERKTETLDQLRLTLISLPGIVAGKLLSVVGVFLVIACAILPVLACVLFLPGVDLVQLVWSFLMVVVCAWSCAAVGIMCSAFFRGTVAATLASYVGSLMLPMGLVYLLIGLVREWLGYVPGFLPSPESLLLICPALGLFDFSDIPDRLLPYALAHQMLICAVCFGFTVLRLRGESRRVRSVDKPPSAEVLEQRRRSFPYFLIDPKAPRKPIEDHRNPMLVKELWGILSRASSAIRLFYVSLFVSAGICTWKLVNPSWELWDGYNSPVSAIMPGMLTVIGLILCITPALLARTFGKEDERGNMDLLRMTLLTPRQIAWGKFLSGIIAVTPAVLGATVGMFLVSATVLFEPGVPGALLGGCVTLVVLVFLSSGLGLFSSVVTRRTGASIVLSYGLSAVAILGIGAADLFGLRDVVQATLGPRWHYLNVPFGYRIPTGIGLFVFLVNHAATIWYHYPTVRTLVLTHWVFAVLAYAAVSCCVILASIWYFRAYRMQDR